MTEGARGRKELPVGLWLEGRQCLVVGSGEEAARRAAALREAGAVVVERAAFHEADLDDVWLAVLAERDAEIARRMSSAAEARRVFFCAVDQPGYGTFSHLAIARRGPLSIAVGTSGLAPALARRLRQELERLLAGSNIEAFVEKLATLREETPGERRQDVLGRAVADVRIAGSIALPADDDETAR